MKQFLTILPLMACMLTMADAAEPILVITSQTPNFPQSAAPLIDQSRAENPLQALCREIFVDVDEGYGVTSKQPRTVCEESR